MYTCMRRSSSCWRRCHSPCIEKKQALGSLDKKEGEEDAIFYSKKKTASSLRGFLLQTNPANKCRLKETFCKGLVCAVRFRFEAKRSENEAKYFSLRSEKKEGFSLVSPRSEKLETISKKKPIEAKQAKRNENEPKYYENVCVHRLFRTSGTPWNQCCGAEAASGGTICWSRFQRFRLQT
jgi:hypothetical protein